jgi:hypothetical protein
MRIISESTSDSKVETRRFTFNLEDVPEQQRNYFPSQIYQPRELRLKVERVDNSLWRHCRTWITGPRVLENGKAEGADLKDEYRSPKDGPGWAVEIVTSRLRTLNDALMGERDSD